MEAIQAGNLRAGLGRRPVDDRKVAAQGRPQAPPGIGPEVAVGGHAFGDLASYLALRTGWDLGEGEVKWAVKMNEREAHDLEKKAHVFFRLIHRTRLRRRSPVSIKASN